MKTKKLVFVILIAFASLNVKGQVCFNNSTNTVVSNPFSSTNSVIADFNNDGNLDSAIIVASGGSTCAIYLRDNFGNFGTATIFNLVGDVHQTIISADFNGDGNMDLAASCDNNYCISLLLGDGAGNFGPYEQFNILNGQEPTNVISADFDGDGKPDMATNNGVNGNIYVLLNTTPFITINATSSIICPGTSVTLTGGGATTYTWSGGITDGIAFVPLTTMTDTITGTTAGCSNTATKTITVLPQPAATFTTNNESSSLFCDGSIIANLTGGTGIIQSQWLDSVQTILSTTDSIGALCPGSYTLVLTDSNNCTNTYTQTIQAGPLPPSPPICLVTVDSTYSHNIVVWEKTNLNLAVIDSFIVYREITSNNFQQIGIVLSDSLSTFNDFTANPETTGFRYKLKSKNTHGGKSIFSDYHNTIYLTNTSANFSWTPYQVENNLTPISTYNIYRDDNSTGNFQLIGNTTGNQFGFTDIQYSSFQNSSYYVEAVLASGSCDPTRSSFGGSRSNIKHIGSAGIQQLNKLSAINIYPNPATNALNITGITEKTTIRMYDLVSKLVMEKEVDSNITIYIDQIAAGVYTLLTNNNTGGTFNKVVINR